MCVGGTCEEPAVVHVQLPMHALQLPQPPRDACGCAKQAKILPVATELRIKGNSVNQSNECEATAQMSCHGRLLCYSENL